VVSLRIKEIYTGILKNRISLIIIKCIFAEGTAILPIVIVLSTIIIVFWFYENMISYKVIIISLFSYINEGICIVWLDHFIEHNDYRLDKP